MQVDRLNAVPPKGGIKIKSEEFPGLSLRGIGVKHLGRPTATVNGGDTVLGGGLDEPLTGRIARRKDKEFIFFPGPGSLDICAYDRFRDQATAIYRREISAPPGS
jgi:hypothetical protein